MPVYVDPPARGTWFGKTRRETRPQNIPSPIEQLLSRLDRTIEKIQGNGELDEEMRHSLMSQALTYEEFILDVRHESITGENEQIALAMASVKGFCELIEQEL